jgi:hypothetical protein
VHASCAHVSLASWTSQRLTNAYLTFVHSQSLQPCPPLPSVRYQYLPRRYHPLDWTCGERIPFPSGTETDTSRAGGWA